MPTPHSGLCPCEVLPHRCLLLRPLPVPTEPRTSLSLTALGLGPSGRKAHPAFPLRLPVPSSPSSPRALPPPCLPGPASYPLGPQRPSRRGVDLVDLVDLGRAHTPRPVGDVSGRGLARTPGLSRGAHGPRAGPGGAARVRACPRSQVPAAPGRPAGEKGSRSCTPTGAPGPFPNSHNLGRSICFSIPEAVTFGRPR